MSDPRTPAAVRVFLPTYRRGRLLQRAIDSLRAQTMPDWICELHNDDPADRGPGSLLAEIGDARFILKDHAENLGGTGTFNLFYDGAPEPFTAILEDDNWWEPRFLETMLATAEQFPQAAIFWSNMRVWQEEADGSFRDTGECVRPIPPDAAAQPFVFGQPEQIFGAIHSNGACLVRCRPGRSFRTPPVPFIGMEMFRERAFPHPMIFQPEPLANFSRTLQSERSDDRLAWAEITALFAASFLKHAAWSGADFARLFRDARSRRPPQTSPLLAAGLVDPSCRSLWKFSTLADWLIFLRGAVARPALVGRLISARGRHADWWRFLDEHTARQFAGKNSTARAEQGDA